MGRRGSINFNPLVPTGKSYYNPKQKLIPSPRRSRDPSAIVHLPAITSKILKLDRRIVQLERLLTGDASRDAKIHKKIHTLRKELCILDPSRKKPSVWTFMSVAKFTRKLKASAIASRSYLSRIFCCNTNVEQANSAANLDAANLDHFDLDQVDLDQVDLDEFDLDGDGWGSDGSEVEC